MDQRPNAESGMLKKLDRIMRNSAFSSLFLNAYANFQPYRISDHSPTILKILVSEKPKAKPFKFANLLVRKVELAKVVNKEW